ncbi:DUF1349 domain-containing protein [Planomonospora alba]|uniref:DUF1349 domain-containing protein n=1 Tax=Planomonospora alba TaxID=161354 RepID=A0ABP6NXS5_9ACTN
MDETVALPAVPVPLRPLNRPENWSVAGEDTIVADAGARTDLFSDPGGPDRFANAPALVGRFTGDFTLSARVRLDARSTYDAGVLLLYGDADHWAKLCLELSPQGTPTIVSVVTRGVSDDCNSLPAESGDVRLRISRLGTAFAFHADLGTGFWHLVRYFALDGDPECGFLAQSPTGEGCAVRFEEIRFRAGRLEGLRTGE